MDQRMLAFAKTLVNYSANVQPGELVYIDTLEDTPVEMVAAIMQEVRAAGGLPYPRRNNERLVRQVSLIGDERLYRFMAEMEFPVLEKTQKGIIIRGFTNVFSQADVPTEANQACDKFYRSQLLNYRRKHKNWILTRWPTPAMAQLFGMSLEQLEEMFFESVSLDYAKMAVAVKPLVDLMNRTDRVDIYGPEDTDLHFSIKGIGAVPCVGHINIPDGECFTAPVRDSVEGVLHYNTLSITKNGKRFEGVRFVFEKGKIVEATCDSGSEADLNAYLDTDEGARYIGEWSLGFNPCISETYGETLFDEKVDGSFHMTPGGCYDDASNGNESAIHWDIVCKQRMKNGGKILFDGDCIREDGRFVHEELQGLNPENLLAE